VKVQIKAKDQLSEGCSQEMLKYCGKIIEVTPSRVVRGMYLSHVGENFGGMGWMWSREDFTLVRKRKCLK
jgi:hypothetical protein